jgi:hypothetical protein
MKNANNRWVTRYPLVHKFFRGYLHQDFPDTYGSLPGAIRAFKEDIGSTDYEKFATEWSGFVDEVHDWPIGEIARTVSEELGAGWNVTSRQELQSFSDAVQRNLK